MTRLKFLLTITVVAAGIWGGVRALRSDGSDRLAAARARVKAACGAYRAAPGHAGAVVCRREDEFGPQILDEFGAAKEEIADAAAMLAAHDAAGATRALRRAVAASRVMHAGGTLMGDAVALRTLQRTFDVLDAHADQLDAATARDILAAAELDPAAYSLDGERLQAMWALAHQDELAGSSMSAAATADAIDAASTAYPAMALAAQANDQAACIRAAAQLEPDEDGGHHRGVCRLLATLAPTLARLAKLHG
jgi:hypothetical protein